MTVWVVCYQNFDSVDRPVHSGVDLWWRLGGGCHRDLRVLKWGPGSGRLDEVQQW